MVRIAIDIGGTFTDVVAETEAGFASVKVLTSARTPEVAALDGINRILDTLSLDLADITGIVHGTTLATNALIERRGAKTAFITTAGFRDVLEMRTEKRFDQYALDIRMPEPLVPRPLRLGLNERILADGTVLCAPQDADIDAVADILRGEGVEAVAIGFLHSYRNPAHEIRVADRLRMLLGDSVTLCQSAAVAGEIREYDRFSTVCANAYVRPLMMQYLMRLESRLREEGFTGSLMMMLSDGALTTLEQAKRFPIRLVEGGPAGGVALAAHVAREIGSSKTLSLDIGGTTAKICFIEDGHPQTTRKFEIARAWRDIKGSGLPVRVPTVELVEIGAGGGSIATTDALGRLKIGPKSAGSEPGPASYGRGGTQATITDAHLTTGNIDPDGFAGGIIDLIPQRGRVAIAEQVQAPLGIAATEPAAAGIVELADETMANAARVHGIELGLDISRFDLLVSGGGGGLHAARIADKLGIRRIVVPENAGVGSAVGFLRSPVAFESAISVMMPLDEIDTDALALRIRETQTCVRATVTAAADPASVEVTVKADLRYLGQGMELCLDMPETDDLARAMPDLAAAFVRRYEALVGFALQDIPIELVSLSVTARERRDRAGETRPPAAMPDDPPPAMPPARRDIYDLTAREFLSYHTLDREAVTARTITGPAVIAEAQTTTLVRPGWSITRSAHGHLILERTPS